MRLARLFLTPEETLPAAAPVRVLRRSADLLWVEGEEEALSVLASTFGERVSVWTDPPIFLAGLELPPEAFDSLPKVPPDGDFGSWLVRLPLPPDERLLDAIAVGGAARVVAVAGPRVVEVVAPSRALPGILERVREVTRGSTETRILPVWPELRLASGLRGLLSGDERLWDTLPHDASGRPMVRVRVDWVRGTAAEQRQQVLAGLGEHDGTPVLDGDTTTWLDLPLTATPELLRWPAVRFVSYRPAAVPCGGSARSCVGLPAVAATDGRFDGSGERVGVLDSGCDLGSPTSLHPDLQGRVEFPAVAWQLTVAGATSIRDNANADAPILESGDLRKVGHGTSMVGLIAGSGRYASEAAAAQLVTGEAAASAQGTAPGATVYVLDVGHWVSWSTTPNPPPAFGPYALPVQLATVASHAVEAGVGVLNCSLATSTLPSDLGVLTADAKGLDEGVWLHPELLVVVAAGNTGPDGRTITPPGTGRNVLTIGATGGVGAAENGTVDNVLPDSARGPTRDGRTKPDLVAPGTDLVSTRSRGLAGSPTGAGSVSPELTPVAGYYRYSGATSGATAVASGAAAVARQVTRRALGRPPTAALLRALLTALAAPVRPYGEDAATTRPKAGFGCIDLTQLVSTGGPVLSLLDLRVEGLRTDEHREYAVTVVDPARPVTVALAWTDAPQGSGVEGLVNRLRLGVTVNAVLVDAEALEGAPAPSAAVNNLQRVVAAPGAAVTSIVVRGEVVGTGHPETGGLAAQPFALVVVNARLPTGVGVTLEPTPEVPVDIVTPSPSPVPVTPTDGDAPPPDPAPSPAPVTPQNGD